MKEEEMSDRELEALREKESAESLIAKKEYEAAMERLLKARQLFPGLEQIDAMTTACEILSAASNLTPSSEVDYYLILQVGPSYPLSSINARYQKLLAVLRPIKNKFLGTDLAIKLINNAFNVLRDEAKRLAFDSRRNGSLTDIELSIFRMSHQN